MIKRWTTLYIALVLLAMIWCIKAPATPVIGNFQSAFRTAGSDVEFMADFSGWDGGTEVVPPTFSFPGAAFTEFGTWGGGSGGTGLGSIVFDIQRAAGVLGTLTGSFHAYFDFEVDESINTFFKEYGEADVLGNGVNPNTFEIDEPGFQFGDIPFNFEAGDLDNFNNVPVSSPDDVAVALGWENFQLLDGQSAILTLLVSDVGLTVADLGLIDPTDVFTLRHLDPDSGAAITFSGALEITGAPPTPPPSDVIPEPSTFILLGCGILGLTAIRLKRFIKSWLKS